MFENVNEMMLLALKTDEKHENTNAIYVDGDELAVKKGNIKAHHGEI